MAERQYDVVVLGATGFTGALTAEYLARRAPDSTRWALGGRNRAKLEDVRGGLGAKFAELPLLHADVNDPESLRKLAESTRVLITTVGPYINYGEPVVAACAAAGTDYVDLTGEPEFVDLMWLRYHELAQETGARIVHSCGFDSIPYDLGALFTVGQLPEGEPINLNGFVRIGGTFSGGTYHSAIHIMGRLRHGVKVARERRARESKPSGRRVRGVPGRPHHDPDAGGWVVPFPTIDPQTVLRSARALDRYGPDFSYSHYLVSKRLTALAALGVGAGAAIALAQLPATRNLLLKLKDPGEGPSEEQRAKSWFRVRMVGRSNGARVVTEVTGGDPGYGETSKMLAESALCLAHDELPERAGQITPAVAMGQPLIDRLQAAGIEFRVVEQS
jgi:short subunit dehydrogenase-like uncharacterized protein